MAVIEHTDVVYIYYGKIFECDVNLVGSDTGQKKNNLTNFSTFLQVVTCSLLVSCFVKKNSKEENYSDNFFD